MPKLPGSHTLDALRARLTIIERGGASQSPVPTGWSEIDTAFTLGGLQRGALHEWVGIGTPSTSRLWSPPLSVLVHLAAEAVTVAVRESLSIYVCWIGKRIWPSVPSLMRARCDLLPRSLFIETDDAASRLWAADLAARSPSALAIVDGTGFDMAASRRLQLAAEAGGWIAHLARPPWQSNELSAAATRWSISREASNGDEPCFVLRLLRSKGLRSMTALDRRFLLQRSDCDRLVLVSPGVSDRPCAEAGEARPEGSGAAVPRRASA